MSMVLYRKWRPQRLDQVVGQQAVTQTLRNAVVQGRVAHAYLFCGPRGTGKTSTARILAKAVNCLAPQDGEPDNACETCVSINEARALDLVEIDAASNRGIDDIRSLRDKIHFTPNDARYKVYIVDEVHMLTEAAFNALLKTLEEPPGHAIFVLATTEAHKVPLTIISRCQRFDFRRIPLDTIVDRLAHLCREEGVEAAPEALKLIARSAGGSLRDAENLLEQAIVSYGSPLGEENARNLLELDSDERAIELVEHIVKRSVRDGLTVINEVAAQGSDLRQFHRAVMEYLRGLMLMSSGAEPAMGYPDEATQRLKSLAGGASLEHLVRALKGFADADLRRDSSSPLPLELALVQSSLAAELEVAPANPGNNPVEPRRPERSQAPRAPRPVRPPAQRNDVASVNEPPRVEVALSDPKDLPSEPSQRLEMQWAAILKSLRRYKGKRFNLGALLRDCKEREVADGTITLKFSYRSHMERMEGELEDPQGRRVLQETLAKAMDSPYDVRVSVIDEENGGPRRSASQTSHLVRAAQAMGARVVGEREEEREQEDVAPGTAASEADARGPAGA